MRENVPLSTCKFSKQTQHRSACLCGCAGLVDDDPAEEDDDFEVEAIDVVSFALVVVSLGFNAGVSDSILAATAPVMCGVGSLVILYF